MKKYPGSYAIAVLMTMVVAGCATIASGTSQVISVSSNVDGATIYLDEAQIGTTPFAGPVKKGKSMIRLEAPGYRNENVSLSKSLDPVFWGNIILGGTLGSITDFGTGAAYQYAPASYQVEMRASGQGEEAFVRQLVTRKFAMIFIDEISRDLRQGGGDHLSALLQIINDGAAVTVDAASVSNAMKLSRGEPVPFGHEVVGLL